MCSKRSNRGSVSIFLCILLTVMSLLSAVLVDSARIKISKSEVRSASDSAAKSILAGYDSMLKELYGLFALAEGDTEALKEGFNDYMNRVLFTELGINGKDLGMDGVKLSNLFDYRIEEVSITPVYSLVNNNVLKGQILQYMKHRAPLKVTKELSDKYLSFIEFGSQSELMGKKVKLDRELYKISELQSRLGQLLEEINAADIAAASSLGAGLSEYSLMLGEKSEEAESVKNSIQGSIESLADRYRTAIYYINDIKQAAGASTQMIKNFADTDLKAAESGFANILRTELKAKEEGLSEVKLNELESRLNEKSSILEGIKGLLNTYVSEALPESVFELINAFSDPAKSISLYEYGNRGNSEESAEKAPSAGVKEALAASLSIFKKEADMKGNKVDRKALVSTVKNDYLAQEKELAARLYDSDAQYITSIIRQNSGIIDSLTESQSEQYGNLNEFVQFLDNPDFSEKGNAEEGFGLLASLAGSLASVTSGLLESLYLNEYISEKFKNSLTEPTSGYETEFDSEIEYIIGGSPDEDINRYLTKGQILLLRFALNTIHIYMDQSKQYQALAAATAVAGWTGFGIPLVQNLIMMAWSMSESILDVHFLMKGAAIPIMKTNETWMLSTLSAIKALLSEALQKTAEEVTDKLTDYAKDEVEKLASGLISEVDSFIDNNINAAVDKVFEETEELLRKAGIYDAKTGTGYSSTGYSAADLIERNPLLKNIADMIESISGEEFSKMRSELMNLNKDTPKEYVKNLIIEKKNVVMDVCRNKVNDIKKQIVNEIEEVSKKGKSELNSYIDNLFGSQVKFQLTKRIQSNIFSMDYMDYLKLFLLIKSDDIKLTRIQDLIQLNMRKNSGNQEYMLKDAFTCLHTDLTVSISRIFSVGNFVKSDNKQGKRYNYRFVHYQNY